MHALQYPKYLILNGICILHDNLHLHLDTILSALLLSNKSLDLGKRWIK